MKPKKETTANNSCLIMINRTENIKIEFNFFLKVATTKQDYAFKKGVVKIPASTEISSLENTLKMFSYKLERK